VIKNTKFFKGVQKLAEKKVQTLYADLGNCLLNTGNRNKRKTEKE